MKAPNCTVDGGHSPAKPELGFNFHPQKGCPAAGKEKVTVALFMILTKNTTSINVNKMQPVSCSQPLEQGKPQNKTMSWKTPRLPNHINPRDLRSFASQVFIGMSRKWLCSSNPTLQHGDYCWLPPQSARSWSRNLMKDFHRGEEVC